MSLHTLFSPKSIAVIGASTTPGSVGNDIAKNLIQSDYSGHVFPVNPKTTELFGRPCFTSISDIPETIDLAIIVVPASIVPTVLREAGEKLVRAVIIISAGFKETGTPGAALEDSIRAIASEYRITLLGPNCLGFIAPKKFLNASFASAIPKTGSIAFFSQSGALMSALLDHGKKTLGFSHFVSIGNKAVIDEALLLEHFRNDPDTKVIGLYTEGLRDAPVLIDRAHASIASKTPKPIIALKSGKTEAGTAASSSHTGAVAGNALAYHALFHQARITEADSFEELIELLATFSQNPLPKGRQITIVTNAGGFGVLATDAAVGAGLEIAQLSPETQEKLRLVLPAAGSLHNPIDLLGDALAKRYQDALEIVASDPNTDLLLILLTPQTMTEPGATAESIVRLKQSHPNLPMVTVMAGKELVLPGRAILEKNNLTVLDYPESGARALGKLAEAANWSIEAPSPLTPTFDDVQIDAVKNLLKRARAENKFELGESTSAEILKKYKFPFLESTLVTSGAEALAAAQKIGKPVALKIVSGDIIHKSDVGGVLLGIAPEHADQAYEVLIETVSTNKPEAKIDGALVVEMAKKDGIELLLGLKKEPGLGTLLVVGLGGIYVEVFHDVALRFLPLTERDLDEMLHELQSSPLLSGTRGHQSVEMNRIKELLARLAQLSADFPEIVELDINPLLVFPDGADFRILDARMLLSQEA